MKIQADFLRKLDRVPAAELPITAYTLEHAGQEQDDHAPQGRLIYTYGTAIRHAQASRDDLVQLLDPLLSFLRQQPG
jgi:hypothetical protein